MSEENKITAYIRVGNEHQMSGKNRIEAIKTKLDTFKRDWEASRGCCDIEDFSDAVHFLLSQLEIAQKAFKEIGEYSNPTGEDAREMRQIADEALQQLRE